MAINESKKQQLSNSLTTFIIIKLLLQQVEQNP